MMPPMDSVSASQRAAELFRQLPQNGAVADKPVATPTPARQAAVELEVQNHREVREVSGLSSPVRPLKETDRPRIPIPGLGRYVDLTV